MDQWLGLPSVAEYQGLSLYNLSLNSAYVIGNTSLDSVFVYSVDDLCYECPFQLVAELKKNVQQSWVVDTSRPFTWRLLNNDLGTFFRNRQRGILCEMRPTLNEFGVYRLDAGRCETKPLVTTYSSYWPLLLFTIILLICGGVYALVKLALKCKKSRRDDVELSLRTGDDRDQSVHLYRGILLLMLMFITSGAGGYPVFTIKYGGLSMADCLFFVFAWTIGIKIPTVVDMAVKKGRSKCSIFGDIFVRSFILILLGVTIDSTLLQFLPATALWRPLEMIGTAYLAVGSAYLLCVHKMEIKTEMVFLKMISNLMSLLWCWIIGGLVLVMIIIFISILTSYNCIIKTPLNSFEYTYAIANQSFYCNNDFTNLINWLFTGEDKKTIFVNGFNGFRGGILGLLSTILAAMVGLKAGIIYLHYENHTDRTSLWALWGLLFSIGAVCFAGMSYAVNCNFWPISAILFLASSSHFFLISVYVVTEYYNLNSLVNTVGQTSLPLLAGHLLFSNSMPFSWPVRINNHSLYLLQNLWIILLWVSVGVFLKRHKILFSI